MPAIATSVVNAVSNCLTPEIIDHGLKVIEVFDKISLLSIPETMRGLDAFDKYWLSHYFSTAVKNKLLYVLGPAVLPKPVKPAKAKRKPTKRRPARQPAARMAA
jgi:hypothetical protein